MKKLIFLFSLFLISILPVSLFADLGERVQVGDSGFSIRPPEGWQVSAMKNGDFCLVGKVGDQEVFLIFIVIPNEEETLIPLENKIVSIRKKELGDGVPITGIFNTDSGVNGRGIFYENFSDTASLAFIFAMSENRALLVYPDRTLPSEQIFELQTILSDSLKTLEL